MQVDHGDLDDVRGAALDGGVDGLAFDGLALVVGQLAAQFREVALAAQQSLHIAQVVGLGDGVGDIALHLGIGDKIAVQKGLGFLWPHLPAGAQPVGADAVDGGEIDGFRQPPLLFAHLFQGHIKEPGRGGGVNVLASLEGGDQALFVDDVGQHPQLHLAVVGGEEQVARRHHEGLADLPAHLRADGDVLQVGVAAAHAPGGRAGLVEAGV